MSHMHETVTASSKISHWNPYVCIKDTFRLILCHTIPFFSIFCPVFCIANCQKTLKLSKNAVNDMMSCCQVKKCSFKYIFNIHSQRLRSRLETGIWLKLEGLFLPIYHTLQRSEPLSEREMLDHKPYVSSANTLVSTFANNRDIAKTIRPSLKLWHEKYSTYLTDCFYLSDAYRFPLL